MATSIRLIRRYVWLVDTIKRAGSISLEEINRKWANNTSLNIDHDDEIPERTFHRHREAIAELFDIDIRCNRFDGNKYYIENEECLGKPSFNSWLFNGLSMENHLLGNREVSDRIIFEQSLNGNDYLSPIIEALSNRRLISINYRRFNENESKEWLVEPSVIKQSRRRWYLVGRIAGNESFTVFALDRITNLQITDQSFIPADIDTIKKRFDEVIGVNLDDDYDCEKVIIRVYGKQRAYIESLPLHHTQQRIDSNKEYSDYELMIRPEYEFQHEILRFGRAAEVVSPKWLCQQMRWLAADTKDRYNGILDLK